MFFIAALNQKMMWTKTLSRSGLEIDPKNTTEVVLYLQDHLPFTNYKQLPLLVTEGALIFLAEDLWNYLERKHPVNTHLHINDCYLGELLMNIIITDSLLITLPTTPVQEGDFSMEARMASVNIHSCFQMLNALLNFNMDASYEIQFKRKEIKFNEMTLITDSESESTDSDGYIGEPPEETENSIESLNGNSGSCGTNDILTSFVQFCNIL